MKNFHKILLSRRLVQKSSRKMWLVGGQSDTSAIVAMYMLFKNQPDYQCRDLMLRDPSFYPGSFPPHAGDDHPFLYCVRTSAAYMWSPCRFGLSWTWSSPSMCSSACRWPPRRSGGIWSATSSACRTCIAGLTTLSFWIEFDWGESGGNHFGDTRGDAPEEMQVMHMRWCTREFWPSQNF